MERITAEEVIAAYKTTGAKPALREWSLCREGRECGCPAFVTIAVRLGMSVKELDDKLDGRVLSSTLSALSGLSECYLRDFARGVDDWKDDNQWSATNGLQDGRAVRRAMIEAGLLQQH